MITFAPANLIMLSKEELNRYNRHLILPELGIEGQEKLKKASVLVIGAGGLGCPILQYLSAAGVGTIGICDFDYIDESNLQRQVLYTKSEIGKAKASVIVEKLAQINPYIEFVVHNLMLKKENVLEIFSAYDIIVDATDNFPTRFLINDACIMLNKPLVFGAIYKFEGQVTVFNYMGGPSYRCLVPVEPSNDEAPSCSQTGVIGAVPGLIGCYQAIEAIKIICNIGKVMSGKMLIIDTLNLMHSMVEIKRSEKTASVKELSEYGDFCREQYSNIKQISPLELFEQLKTLQIDIIDIRDEEKFKEYHIKSMNIPISRLLAGIESIPKEKMSVIVCESGNNSMALIDSLNKTGIFHHLYNLDGGITAWKNSGFPLLFD